MPKLQLSVRARLFTALISFRRIFRMLDFLALVPRRIRWPPLVVGIQTRRISSVLPEMILYSMMANTPFSSLVVKLSF